MILGKYTCYFCEEEYDELVEVIGKGNMCQSCFDREYDTRKYYQVWVQNNPDDFDDMSAYGVIKDTKEEAKRMAKAIAGGLVMELRPVFRNPIDFGKDE